MTEETKSRYLEYLPAIHQQDTFLGRFLLPFEEVLTGFGELLSTVDRYFAPAFTDPEFLSWLAAWVALVLDEDWDEAKRRRLIGEAVELYRWRGTVRGLKRYLEIYTGLVPDIRECRWPGGMQIGVASQIGCTIPQDASLAYIESVVHSEPPDVYGYYVVNAIDNEGKPIQVYHRADRVTEVTVDGESVAIEYYPPNATEIVRREYSSATVTRRDGLVDNRYTLGVGTETDVEYRGDTFLVDEVELPYRFIVDVRVPLADVESVKLDKVRAIVDLEKPAHTAYYLKLTPVVSKYVLQPMQIQVRSTIEVDTTLG
jgi:phage tail-like protein